MKASLSGLLRTDRLMPLCPAHQATIQLANVLLLPPIFALVQSAMNTKTSILSRTLWSEEDTLVKRSTRLIVEYRSSPQTLLL